MDNQKHPDHSSDSEVSISEERTAEASVSALNAQVTADESIPQREMNTPVPLKKNPEKPLDISRPGNMDSENRLSEPRVKKPVKRIRKPLKKRPSDISIPDSISFGIECIKQNLVPLIIIFACLLISSFIINRYSQVMELFFMEIITKISIRYWRFAGICVSFTDLAVTQLILFSAMGLALKNADDEDVAINDMIPKLSGMFSYITALFGLWFLMFILLVSFFSLPDCVLSLQVTILLFLVSGRFFFLSF